ncbi:MAG TPA: toll/interleukin-1 receptor domain-containing protein [Blastocatellia bacterium]|nr:toll/interleukin-1 receptor domain-containing protein [Blastocatellia bacterium]
MSRKPEDKLQIDEQWLQDAGYENHCFVSYPRINNPEMIEIAEHVKDRVENDLSYLVSTPRVFLDRQGLSVGAVWEENLRRALCKSVTMVALCSPMYYSPIHRWCILEWEAMYGLSLARLPAEDFRAIIPLIVRTFGSVPSQYSSINYIDISRVTLRGRRYFGTNEFREAIRQVTNQIARVADALKRNQSRTECERFQFPQTPPPASPAAEIQPQSFWGPKQ